jgi:hypothetical protein
VIEIAMQTWLQTQSADQGAVSDALTGRAPSGAPFAPSAAPGRPAERQLCALIAV